MKQLNVLLISTLTGEGAGYVKHGIGLISACLKKEGHVPMVLNSPNYTRKALSRFKPHVVGIYGMSNSVNRMFQCARLTREYDSKVPIFAGGVVASLSPDNFDEPSALELFDFIFGGEAEITFIDIVNNIAANGSLPSTRRISGEVIHRLDELPFVDRSGYEKGEQKHNLLKKFRGPMFTMLNSRWCRKNCRFCAPASKTIFGGVKKLRSVGHFIDEIMTLPQDAVLMIHDDNMIENLEWADEFAKSYRSLGNPFICQAYPAEIVRAEETLSKLKAVGLVGVLVGFESGSDRMLHHMRKGTTRDINEKAAHILHQLKIGIQANLMFGSPSETRAEMMETVHMFNDHIYPAIPSPAVYTPYPGSHWYEELTKKGLITISDPKQYDRNCYTQNKILGVDYRSVQKAIAQLKSDMPVVKKVVRSLRQWSNKY
jgi:radical SAM superfamily enzyme YgiQ (UPF0313 family)